jgi:VanZ family protein
MNFRRPIWAWLFFVQLILVAGATILATRGALPTGLFRAPLDKVGHLGAYGLLAFLGVSFFGPDRRWRVIGALLLVSTLDEFSQRAFPTRTFDLGDLAMNVVGIVTLGSLAARLLGRGRLRRAAPVR